MDPTYQWPEFRGARHSRRTFRNFFNQQELHNWTGPDAQRPVSASRAEVFYVFRWENQAAWNPAAASSYYTRRRETEYYMGRNFERTRASVLWLRQLGERLVPLHGGQSWPSP
jgi:hypothetical protein